MADRTIKINIRTDAEQALVTVEDLKKELKSLKSQFEGETIGTQAFNNLGTQIKSVSKEIKDVNNQVKSLDSNQRTAALVDTFRGLVGAVGAVSSAFVAFGADASAIDNAEKKLLGIIGVVQGVGEASKGLVAINKLTGGSFTQLGATIAAGFKTGATGAQTFKAALISTGIGALIVAVGFLIANFDKLGLSTESNTDKANRLADANDALKTSIDLANESIDAETALLKAQGIELKKINDIKIKGLEISNQRLKAANDELTLEIANILNLGDLNDEITEQEQEAADKLEAVRTKNEINIKKNNVNILNLKQEVIKEQNTLDDKADTEAKKRRDDRITQQKDASAKEQNAIKDKNEALRKLDEARAIEGLDAITTQFANNSSRLKETQTDELNQLNLTNEAKAAINEKYRLLALTNEESRIKAVDKFNEDASKVETDRIAKEVTELAEFQKRAFGGEIKALGEFYTARENEVKTQFEQGLITQQQYNTQLDQLEFTRLNNILQATKDAGESTIAVEKDILDKKIALKDKDVETTKKTEEQKKALQDLAFDSALSLIGDLQSLNEIFDNDSEEASKKAFNRNKNLSIAEAIISTYLAAQKAYTSQLTLTPDSPIRASIAAAVAIASGLARVAVIKSQKFDGGGSTGGGGTAGGSTGSSSGGNILNPFSNGEGGTNVLPPRLAPPSGGSGTQAGNQQQGLGNIPIVKAYVLAGDVTDAQVANEKINQKRKF
jgi:hypothetical protein